MQSRQAPRVQCERASRLLFAVEPYPISTEPVARESDESAQGLISNESQWSQYLTTTYDKTGVVIVKNSNLFWSITRFLTQK